jgi:hypothetical protein
LSSLARRRNIARVLGLSLLSGALLGIAARVVMRFIALESGLDGGFSVGGSLEVVAFGLLVGTPVALAFLSFRRRLSVPAPWGGVAVGLCLFFVLSVLQPPSAQSALAGTPDTPEATAVAFGVMFAAWGVFLDSLARRM